MYFIIQLPDPDLALDPANEPADEPASDPAEPPELRELELDEELELDDDLELEPEPEPEPAPAPEPPIPNPTPKPIPIPPRSIPKSFLATRLSVNITKLEITNKPRRNRPWTLAINLEFLV